MTAFAAVRAAAERLGPRAAVVLGSGLSGAAAGFEPAAAVGYAEVPGLTPPTVAGHRGQLAVGTWAGVPVLVFAGRIHFYEGHPWERVTRPVRLAAELGAKLLVLTNAAGGIHPALGPGSLMAIRGHVKLLDREGWKLLASRASRSPSRSQALLGNVPSGASLPPSRPHHRGGPPGREAPLRGLARKQAPEEARKAELCGARSQAELGNEDEVYSPRLVALLQQLDPTLFAGTYAAVTGPCYETPAEVRALAALGADAVGMSTAMEAEAAAGLGLEVCGLSSVTNRAAGLSAGTLTHAEVADAARRAAGRVGELIGRLLAALAPQ